MTPDPKVGILKKPWQRARTQSRADTTPGHDRHLTSTTWGKVVSPDSTDAVGHGPGDLAAWPRTP